MTQPIDPSKSLLENYLCAINSVLSEMQPHVDLLDKALDSQSNPLLPPKPEKPARPTEK